VFIKRTNERREHVLMKAFLWALYLPAYPDLVVEIRVGDRYKPDIVSLDSQRRPRFWGEAGHVGMQKVRALTRRYRNTHFAIAKWDTRLAPFVSIVGDAVVGLGRTAPVDLISFPSDSAARFVDSDGCIHLTHSDVEWTQIL
jgi:hypothetical protein